ncbi:MAG: KEOPS complex subunit Cgi121 [Candidatus Bathyarchaeota archaeon]|nr:KEOPS complex subunit Cgi121 [Candidatus Bathyarchaeota archaeon]
MIKKLEDFDKYVAIAGFRNVKINDFNNFFGQVRKNVKDTHIQLFDAKLIAGREHLYFAVLNALRAFEGRLNISNSLAVEALLYASAQRQISKAVDLLGIKSESTHIAVLVIAETKQWTNTALEMVSRLVPGERDDGVLELTDEKVEDIRRLFDISDLELEAKLEKKGLEKEALIDLVIEHVALLVTRR